MKSGKALVAISVGYLKGGLIAVRFMNLSEDSQIVYPVTLVASLSNVDVVIDSSYDQEYHCDNVPPSFRRTLCKIDRTTESR